MVDLFVEWGHLLLTVDQFVVEQVAIGAQAGWCGDGIEFWCQTLWICSLVSNDNLFIQLCLQLYYILFELYILKFDTFQLSQYESQFPFIVLMDVLIQVIGHFLHVLNLFDLLDSLLLLIVLFLNQYFLILSIILFLRYESTQIL